MARAMERFPDIRFWAEEQWVTERIKIHGVIHGSASEKRPLIVLKPVEQEVIEDGFMTDPFMVLEREQAQQLMDQLWKVGLRPSEGKGSAGQLAAVERHLADVQKDRDWLRALFMNPAVSVTVIHDPIPSIGEEPPA